MVHQHFMLVDTMTVAENIVLGAETGSAANLDLEKANRGDSALSNELKLGVDPKAYIEDLSVGQQQRVELLKALYRNAELLILDEPTAVLIAAGGRRIFRHPSPDEGAGQDDHHHHAQARRGARDLGRSDGDA